MVWLNCLLMLLVLSSPAYSDGGDFVRQFWFEPGIENGNPKYNGNFRVNSPETVLSEYKERREVRGNGMMLIKMEEYPHLLQEAHLYLELWGGHPGTMNKRVSINGRSTYEIPKVGSEKENCTYQYPLIPLKITDLVNGYNSFQFACDQGTTFWGHYIVNNACLRATLQPDHPSLSKLGLSEFEAALESNPKTNSEETLSLHVNIPDKFKSEIANVLFQGYYLGYDENGNQQGLDWHGFTKDRAPLAFVGADDEAPFQVQWDVSMLPSQNNMAVRAVIQFKKDKDLVFITKPLRNLATPKRDVRVMIHETKDMSRPCWSRANRPMKCNIELDENPQNIEQAQLHVVIWDGGKGETEHPFTLNGHPLNVAGRGAHDVLYRIVDVDPAILKQGVNEIVVLSDTEHHGIEILLPGPALIVRFR
jgi:hypothetical protein